MIIMRIKLQMYIVAAATIASRYYDFNLIVMRFVCISRESLPLRYEAQPVENALISITMN